MAEALIFDIDGTLLDSVDLHARAWREALEKFGHLVPFTAVRNQIGKGGDQLLPVFLSPDEMRTEAKQIEEYRSRLFKEKYLSQVRPFPGVRALFEEALAHNQRIALASSAKEDELEAYKRIAEIEDLVQTQTSSADAEKSKPHPDIFEAAIERLGKGIDRQRILVIGDSPYDVEAARRAGMNTVCVRCGGFAEESLRSAGCLAIYDDPADILRHYESSPLAPA
jgi:HAD superfamily hydrolase (TIGR01509 family)